MKLSFKEQYAKSHSIEQNNSNYLNKRLFSTYNRISKKTLNKELQGINIDLGSGDKGFSKYLTSVNITSFAYDYPDFDIEKDKLPHTENSIDFITLNAVIEHINNPNSILKEINRVLKINGLVFIRTPNWQMDYKNFYNDPTHVKPYTPQSLKSTLHLSNFKSIFLEPGLIEKNWFWWKLPNFIKWRVASLLKNGTKSILCVASKFN